MTRLTQHTGAIGSVPIGSAYIVLQRLHIMAHL
jgi:hypothetical protein